MADTPVSGAAPLAEASMPAGSAPTRRYVLLLTSALTLIALVSIIGLMPIPYVSLRPGPAIDTLGTDGNKPLITFGKKVKTYQTLGRLDFTSVMVTRSDHTFTLLDAVAAWFSPDSAVAPRDLLYGDDETSDDTDEKLQAQLTSAKDFSQYAALTAAGYEVDVQTSIVSVTKGSPAAGILRKDDVIVAVDGKKHKTVNDVVKAVSSRKPGTKVTLTIQRSSKELTRTLDTVPNPEDKKKARVGVALQPRLDYPFPISNNVAQIGGPSAGSMFALAIYDRLTPGSLTGGRHIAGTGTISLDGRIGPIGSVRQKLAGASEAGAVVFLVPAKNCPEAVLDADDRGRVDGMRLVKVKTLKDAISSLRILAGQESGPVPACGLPH